MLQTAVYASLFLFFDCLNVHLSISGFFIPCSCRKSLKNSFNCRFFVLNTEKMPSLLRSFSNVFLTLEFQLSFTAVSIKFFSPSFHSWALQSYSFHIVVKKRKISFQFLIVSPTIRSQCYHRLVSNVVLTALLLLSLYISTL